MSSQSAAHRSASQATVNAYQPAPTAPKAQTPKRKSLGTALVSVAILSGFAYFVPAVADWAATYAH